jgi:hypothetical protein
MHGILRYADDSSHHHTSQHAHYHAIYVGNADRAIF